MDSGDGLLGVEATATLKRLVRRLSNKWNQPFSKMCGYIKTRTAITFVCATYISKYRDPGCRRTRSVFSGPSGKMAQSFTSSGKRVRDHQINHPPQPPQAPPHKIPTQQTTT